MGIEPARAASPADRTRAHGSSRNAVPIADRSAALEYVEQLLGHHPWREDALRDLLMLRFNAGDRAGALAYYRRFCQPLGSEFGVEPMPETVKCFESISSGSYLFIIQRSSDMKGILVFKNI